MKKLEVLSASNSDPRYLDCVRHFIEFWLLMNNNQSIEFRPKVILIGSSIPETLFDLSEFIDVYDSAELSTVATSQIIRLLMPSLSQADYVMTSDIDMLPLSTRIETNILGEVNLEERIFVNTRDVLPPGQFPICYNIASPAVWARVTGVSSRGLIQEKLREVISEFSDPSGISDTRGGASWYMDQSYLYSILSKDTLNFSLRLVNDLESKHRRLDRAHHRFPLNWMVLPLVALGYYHDYHVHHPISENLRYIRVLRKFVLFNKRLRYV